MRSNHRTVWIGSVVCGALLCGVLGLFRESAAAPREDREPFANATAQRAEMISLLKEIHAQLKEQNALLSSGKLVVTVAKEEQPQ